MLLWTIGYARIPLKYYAALFGSALLFFAASLPALAIELREGSLAWSDSGLHTAVQVLFRATACLSAMLFVILTTPMAQLFQVLRKIGIPSLVIELMLIMYRFLFLLLETAREMMMAQRARGGHSGFKRKLRDTAMLVTRLFAATMQRYHGLARGLTARGFTDDIRLAPYEGASLSRRRRAEICIGLPLLAAAEIWLRWEGFVWPL
jgi:cobalt/nickel transport system permease protein